MNFTAAFLGAALAAHFAVRTLLRLAPRQLLDLPNQRSSHTAPTPRGGGIGIAGVILLTWLVGAARLHDVRWLFQAGLFGAIAALGFCDDLWALSARLRLTLHSVVGLLTLFLWRGFEEIDLPFLGVVDPSYLGPALTLLWLVGMVNAYNFMDGVDGIAATQGAFAAAAWAVLGLRNDAIELTWLGVVSAGACLGFLIHNWPPAEIFLGDLGSTSLGYLFALLPFVAAHHADASARTSFPFGALLLVWPFVFDAAYTFLRRLVRRENVFAAHRSHLYQRCTAAGWSHSQVTTFYGSLACVCAAAGCLWVTAVHTFASQTIAALVFALVPIAQLTVTFIAERERPDRSSPARQTSPGN